MTRLNDKQATRLGRGIRHRSFGNLPAMAHGPRAQESGIDGSRKSLSFLNQ